MAQSFVNHVGSNTGHDADRGQGRYVQVERAGSLSVWRDGCGHGEEPVFGSLDRVRRILQLPAFPAN